MIKVPIRHCTWRNQETSGKFTNYVVSRTWSQLYLRFSPKLVSCINNTLRCLPSETVSSLQNVVLYITQHYARGNVLNRAPHAIRNARGLIPSSHYTISGEWLNRPPHKIRSTSLQRSVSRFYKWTKLKRNPKKFHLVSFKVLLHFVL